MNKVVISLFALVIGFIAYAVHITTTFEPPNYPPLQNLQKNLFQPNQQEQREIAERLSGAIQFKTIYYKHHKPQFDALFEYLEKTFPQFHKATTREKIKDTGVVLYKWEGTDTTLNPILFTAHVDVVPSHNENDWTYPPFSGKIVEVENETYIWGRGTLDDKESAVGLMETAEQLLKQNFRPKRTIYFSIAADEEVGGNGARTVTEIFKERGVKFDFVFDEGGFLVKEQFPAIDQFIALVAISEKGMLTLNLSLECEPGHASIPPTKGCIGALARAITRLEDYQMPAHVNHGPVKEMLSHIGPYSKSFGMKLLFAMRNWLYKLLEFAFSMKPSTNAMIRTTTAVTVFKGGVQFNVMPSSVSALVNFRVHPMDSINKVIDHVIKTINNPKIKVEKHPYSNEPSNVSCTDCHYFNIIRASIREVFPDVIIAPYLFIAASDSRYYRQLSPNAYGFIPYRLLNRDVNRIHGIDERISQKNYIEIIQFYITLFKNLDKNL